MTKIAVLGYGTVGSGVVEVLNTNGACKESRRYNRSKKCFGFEGFSG